MRRLRAAPDGVIMVIGADLLQRHDPQPRVPVALAIGPALRRAVRPVRVVVGERDAVIPAQGVTAPDPAIAWHRLPGVGHMPQIEAPELVGRLLIQTAPSAG